jgi:transcription elongation factor Elf1
MGTSHSSKDGIQSTLVHVHACIHCGHMRQREEVDGREVGSGVLHCHKCNLDGPLNVEIRGTTEFASEDNGLQTKGSSGQR